MQDIDSTKRVISTKFVRVQLRLPDLNMFGDNVTSPWSQLPACTWSKRCSYHGCLNYHVAVAESFITNHALWAISATARMDTLPVNTAMNPYTLARTDPIRSCLNRTQRMLRISVIRIRCVGVRGIYMVFFCVSLIPLPEIKFFAAREAVLQVTFHKTRHTANRIKRCLWTVSMFKKEWTALLTAKSGQPAFFVLKPPEGYTCHVRSARFFLFQ